jgi:hypothetical protein
MRIIHCFRLRLKTGKLPRSERPSAVISSFATTVPSPGHQFTGASLMYASRWSSTMRRRSTAVSCAHGRPSGVSRSPVSYAPISVPMGRARPSAGSNHELKICRKIHCVHL